MLTALLLLTLQLDAAPAEPSPDGTLSAAVAAGTAVEISPAPPHGALEEGMSGAVLSYYAHGIAATRDGNFRRALPLVREARALCYRMLQNGPLPRRVVLRHFVRTAYVEEQLSELTLVEEQIGRPLEHADDRQILLQLRAVLLHNLYLAVRSFVGKGPPRLLSRALGAYELAMPDPGRSRAHLQVGYAALLAEKGNRREARAVFNRLTEADLQPDTMDLAVAYYYGAIGDVGRAVTRLSDASRRDGWSRGGPGRDGLSRRYDVYRMHDFDRLRDHPRFRELISEPEESLLGLEDPPGPKPRPLGVLIRRPDRAPVPGSGAPAPTSQSASPASPPRP